RARRLSVRRLRQRAQQCRLRRPEPALVIRRALGRKPSGRPGFSTRNIPMTLKPVFAALAVLMLAVPAAQAAPAAVAATDYEAWSLRCEARPAAAAKTCGLTQTVTVKGPDGKDGVAMVVLLRQVGGSDKLQLSLNLPITVLLPDGV